MLRTVRAAVILFAGLLAACTVGPNFHPPKPPADPAWLNKGASRDAGTLPSDPDPAWWTAFRDPVLDRLIAAAIAGNPDLQESLLRVVEAHQQVVSTAASGLPMLNGDATAERTDFGLRSTIDALGTYKQLRQLQAPDSTLNKVRPGLGNQTASTINGVLDEFESPTNFYQYELSSSWEVDLFGRIRRQVEAARADQQQRQEAANDALVMLEGQVAQSYVQYRAAGALAAQQQDNIADARAALALTQQRLALGLSSDLDVEQSRTELLTQEAQLPAYQKQAAQAADALDALVGAVPGTLQPLLAAPDAGPAIPRAVAIGVPSSLARRRPDVREAEAQLHAATADVGVAVASFYPDISLTGDFGFQSPAGNLLTSWESVFYSIGPTIRLPIFQGGRLTANLRMAHAAQAEAALNYRGTVLNALREVEDALAAYSTDTQARDATAASVASAAHSFSLAETRYQLGLASSLQVLEAERMLLAQRQALVQANMQLAADVVQLYTALGGGWQLAPDAVPLVPVTAPLPPLPGALDSVAADGMR